MRLFYNAGKYKTVIFYLYIKYALFYLPFIIINSHTYNESYSILFSYNNFWRWYTFILLVDKFWFSVKKSSYENLPMQFLGPPLKGMNASLLLFWTFSGKKWSGSNFSGFGNICGFIWLPNVSRYTLVPAGMTPEPTTKDLYYAFNG